MKTEPLETVWTEYRGALKGFLQKRVSDPDDVDDLLQDILIKTHLNLGKLRETKSLKAWLFSVARNAVTDHYRATGKTQPAADDLWYHKEDPDTLSDFTCCLKPFIESLPPENADLLTQVDLNGQSQKDYAKRVGIPYSTFKSRVQKSRDMLRHRFEDCCRFTLDGRGNIMDCDAKEENLP